MEKEREILNGIQSQISSFDNKASILLSVVGIIFALTLSFLDVFHLPIFIEKTSVFKTFYYILFIIYVVVTITLITLFILVIIPRKHRRNQKYPNYYRDIASMSDEELEKSISEYKSKAIIEQISENARICSIKHNYLKTGIFMFIPFALCIIPMIMMTVFA